MRAVGEEVMTKDQKTVINYMTLLEVTNAQLKKEIEALKSPLTCDDCYWHQREEHHNVCYSCSRFFSDRMKSKDSE